MSDNVFNKDKDEVIRVGLEWSTKLASGDSIVASAWDVESGITKSDEQTARSVTSLLIAGGAQQTWYVATNTVTTALGETLQDVIRVFIKPDVAAQPPMGSALFPDRFAAVQSIRRDRLAVAAAGALPSVEISDDYIWEKLLAAEAAIGRDLRVYLQPTYIIPDDASQAEVDEVAARGIPWAQEAAYDYQADFFSLDQWGYLILKQKPLVSIDSVRFAYPSTNGQVFDVPREWMRMDKKKGHINIVPTSVGFALPVSGFLLQFLGGSHVPFMIQARYTAGLVNAATNWPDLVDVVKKQAVLDIVADAYLPSSGSISADGLSQTMSVDMSTYRDTIDYKINGGKGSNGGLRTAIHGITLAVMGR